MCVVQVLFAKLLLDRNGSSPRMSQLWVQKSQVLEFSQTNWLYSLKEYILDNAEKLWFGFYIEICSFCVFGQRFFSFFSKLTFMHFFNFFYVFYDFGILIFSKFGMYLTYKNRFWGHFSWFLGRDINSTVWTRNGSKIEKQVMVFKGLVKLKLSTYWRYGPPIPFHMYTICSKHPTYP